METAKIAFRENNFLKCQKSAVGVTRDDGQPLFQQYCAALSPFSTIGTKGKGIDTSYHTNQAQQKTSNNNNNTNNDSNFIFSNVNTTPIVSLTGKQLATLVTEISRAKLPGFSEAKGSDRVTKGANLVRFSGPPLTVSGLKVEDWLQLAIAKMTSEKIVESDKVL